MRLPLVPFLIVLVVNLLIDMYIWRRLSVKAGGTRQDSRLRRAIPKIHILLSAVFTVGFVVVISYPKKDAGEVSFEWLMWWLYVYFSIYIPKAVFVLFDLLARIPRLFGHRSFRWLSAAGAVVGVFIFGLMWWGAFVNRYNIDVNDVDVEIDGLPSSFDGYRIAQISDLHVGTFDDDDSFVRDLVSRVNSLHPDLIVFTGDIVNRYSDELRPFVKALSGLSAPDGVLSILGNHDYGDYYKWSSDAAKAANLQSLKDMQADMGWRMLNNDHVVLRRGAAADSIVVIGVENVGDPPFHTYGDLDAAYPALADPAVKILLSHNPAHWVDDIAGAPDKNIALTLSGHTHAMQISLFGLSPAAWRYPTWGGIYDDGEGRRLYVNIGAGEVAIPARIGATPEITLIELKSKK